jgi:hypothetical protein
MKRIFPMMHSFLSLSLVLPLLASAPVPNKAESPKGSLPELLLIQEVDTEKGTLTHYLLADVRCIKPTKVRVKVDLGGGMVIEKEEVVEVVIVEQVKKAERVINLNDKRIIATDTFGKPLSKEAVWKLVTPGKKVAITHDPNGLEPTYRSTLAPDVVILIFPPPEVGAR